MAETAVSILIEQLAPLLIQEVKLLGGAKEAVATIQHDLEMIRAFLCDADRQQHTNEAVKVWVKQVRETAYDIEDVIDEFFYRMQRPNSSGFAGFLRKNTGFFRRLMARHRVGNQVQDLRNRLNGISERQNRFSFAAVAGSNTRANFNIGDSNRLAAQFVEESQVVGIEKPREELIGRLLEQKWKYAVVSVVGMGGLGKTTLVRKVYEDPRVQNVFACHAWITVSQTFVPDDLLRSLINELQVAKTTEELSAMSYVRLVETLRTHLQKQRYVIVLDDVWTIDAWEVIKCALPENKCGSRIMVTTRMTNLATYCSTPNENIHMLQPLPKEKAWSLFCKKVFGAEHENGCPHELEPTANKILEVCGGLPLAIVAIGGVLSTKRKALTEWETIYQSIRSELETNNILQNIKNILWLSYDDLPHHLKPCFLYFGIFPEDFSVKRTIVTRLWIAEGFIKPMDDQSFEVVSESYLIELIQRSLVQPFKLEHTGRVITCRVHDFLYELILSKSREQDFHLRLERGKSELPDNVRRLVVDNGQSVRWKSDSSHLRSLLLLGVDGIPELANFGSLKVLHIEGVQMDSFPTEILELFHLRYLHMRKTNISSLPKGIGKLRNLQTLDMKWSLITSLPNEILKLKNLRHILIYKKVYYGVEMPKKIGNLTSLQSLVNVNITGGADELKELCKLTQLKKLSITQISSSDGDDLCATINHMSQLQSLYLFSGKDGELLNVEKLSVNPTILRRLNLRGKLTRFPEVLLSLNCLELLRLNFSKLEIDPFSYLHLLPSLVELYLFNGAYVGAELYSQSPGFLKLKKLYIHSLNGLHRVVINQGAMPGLEYLEFLECDSLERVPVGIENLRNIKELYLGLVPEECMVRIKRNEGKDWENVKHIPIIKKVYKKDGGFREIDI